MEREFKFGDRVRVTSRNRMHGYQPGDIGVVMREVTAGLNGSCYYVVAMDEDAPSRNSVVFSEDEFGPDE